MVKARTETRLRLRPHQVRPFEMKGAGVDDLDLLGIQFSREAVQGLQRAYSMDAAGPATITSASAGVPVQFLQYLLPGAVRVVTAARKIDDIVGRNIAGRWHDEEIVQTIVEQTGQARPYGDYAAGPLANFNLAFERRTIVRFELDLEVPILEELRAAEVRQNSGAIKRAAVSDGLAIEQNRIGFFGYNDGECRTYGFLNDPYLPNYQTVPAGSSGGTEWASKDFQEIIADLRLAASTLRTQSKEVVDPEKQKCTLALSSAAREAITTTTDMGVSVLDWIRKNYPGWAIESAPELDEANGGQNVFYLFAEEVPGGEDGMQQVVAQYVPTVFFLLGVEKKAKGTYEAYSNATAGTMWKVPMAVVRYTGI